MFGVQSYYHNILAKNLWSIRPTDCGEKQIKGVKIFILG
jgi:hypothetical protein